MKYLTSERTAILEGCVNQECTKKMPYLDLYSKKGQMNASVHPSSEHKIVLFVSVDREHIVTDLWKA